MRIEQWQYVHPDEVAASATPGAEDTEQPTDLDAPPPRDHVAEQRAWLEHYLITEADQVLRGDQRDRQAAVLQLRQQGKSAEVAEAQASPLRYTGRGEPVLTELEQPHHDLESGVIYTVGWHGFIEVFEA